MKSGSIGPDVVFCKTQYMPTIAIPMAEAEKTQLSFSSSQLLVDKLMFCLMSSNTACASTGSCGRRRCMSPASWLHHTQVRRQSAPPSQGSLRTRQAPHVWNVKLESMLSKFGFRHNDYEHAVYTHDKGPARLLVDVPNHHRQLSRPDQQIQAQNAGKF
jgi:hypothetical protein